MVGKRWIREQFENSELENDINSASCSDALMVNLQNSEKALAKITEHFNIDTSKIDSILLYSPTNGITYKSTAALKIAHKLGFPRNLLVILLIVPPFIRNWVYDYIAKNRYKWYGKREECMVPTKELMEKFV